MKVFVFKPSNATIGSFSIERIDSVAQGLAQFATTKPVNPYDYLECSGKTWTVIGGQDGLELQEGRLYHPNSQEAKSDEAVYSASATTTPSKLNAALFKRYKDAFTEAHAVVTVGKVIKGVGIFLGICVILAGLALGSNSSGGAIAMIGGFVSGCIVGIPTYVLGILVAAQGQTQLATLDTAVNGSRHLTDDEVAQLLAKKWSL